MRVLENNQSWKKFIYDLTGRAGHTIQLYFEVYNNYTNPYGRTWMYVDDVSVQACNNTQEPCYPLTLSHNGLGADPVAVPMHSASCPIGQFVAGETITLTADPAADWHVASWTGTENNASTSTTNTVDMPAAAHTASVKYEQDCHALRLSHTGNGADPVAAPTQSRGCPAGQYYDGETITLTADPAADWHVASWTGTQNNASTSTTNTVDMPAAAHRGQCQV